MIMNEPSLKKNFALSTLYQILLLIVPFVTAPYVSRVLTADGIGIYSFTNSIQMYFSMFAALGTVSYGTREIARVRNDKNTRESLHNQFCREPGAGKPHAGICVGVRLVRGVSTHQERQLIDEFQAGVLTPSS